MIKIRNCIMACITSIILVGIDQYTKFLAVESLDGKGEVIIIPYFFVLDLVYNRGAFLSLGHNLPDFFWFLTLVAFPIIFLISFTIYTAVKKSQQASFVFIWSLIFSGAVGNLIDRIAQGKVVDFIRVGIGWLRSGTFNFADAYITIAIVIFLFFFWRKDSKG